MKGAVLYGPRDVRFEEREAPKIEKPADVIIRISATCVCGSDLWPYREIQQIAQPTPMGHEYCRIVEEVGKAVKSVKPGQFVMGSFFCLRQYLSQLQLRIPVFVRAPGVRWHRPAARAAGAACGRHARRYSGGSVAADDPEPADVMGTGWFAADAANVKAGLDGRGRRRRRCRTAGRPLRKTDGR